MDKNIQSSHFSGTTSSESASLSDDAAAVLLEQAFEREISLLRQASVQPDPKVLADLLDMIFTAAPEAQL